MLSLRLDTKFAVEAIRCFMVREHLFLACTKRLRNVWLGKLPHQRYAGIKRMTRLQAWLNHSVARVLAGLERHEMQSSNPYKPVTV